VSVKRSDSRPETLRQAGHWDVTASYYRRAGLCDCCAAQAAWGHQTSFGEVLPPCVECRSAVLAFPEDASREWRAFSKTRRTISNLETFSTFPGRSAPETFQAVTGDVPLHLYVGAA
jgi:hypothetical protein